MPPLLPLQVELDKKEKKLSGKDEEGKPQYESVPMVRGVPAANAVACRSTDLKKSVAALSKALADVEKASGGVGGGQGANEAEELREVLTD